MTARRRCGLGPALTAALAVCLGTGLALAGAWAQGADIPWLPAPPQAAVADAGARAAAALAEVCSTPAQLPRRATVARVPRRDPFQY
jgi:hypothetical protein